MSNEVYANGRELSCKSGQGKSVCAFPDVCFTPPLTPATPPGVPIPYPNTGMTTDTSNGSKTVQISGKEVMIKDSSAFSTSTGDEAGSAPKKNVITSKIKGKCYFTAWSMDVKIEGENAVRHLDLMTHNHASTPGATPPWPFMDAMATPADDKCAKEKAAEQEACKDYAPQGTKDVCAEAGLTGGVVQSNADARALGHHKASAWANAEAKKASANKCASARRCKLTPYNAPKDGVNGCCPSQTADHLIPKSSFYEVSVDDGKKCPGWSNYDMNKAPCLCAEGGSNTAGSHGLRHAHHKSNGPGKGASTTLDAEAKLAAKGSAEVFKSSGCSEECIEAQLKKGHEGMGDDTKPIKHSPSGRTMSNADISAQSAQLQPTVVAP